MSIGSWDPSAANTATTATIDAQTLVRLAGYSRNEQLDSLEALLGDTDVQVLSGLMHQPPEQWQAAADALDNNEILHLIRFFAVAENLPGWAAGADSPVIPLAKVLRQRGERLDKSLLQWLREVNENRFLPYGPL
tara:strand:+ start:38661 stop:39065 length:405 start_codon:yes stop_codon:yes gene_type:complete